MARGINFFTWQGGKKYNGRNHEIKRHGAWAASKWLKMGHHQQSMPLKWVEDKKPVHDVWTNISAV